MPRPAGLRGALVTMLLVRGIASVPPAAACGPYLPSAIFTRTTEPDVPVDRFVAGTLGILKPTMKPVFLYAAYRRLAGPPLDDDEGRVLTQLVSASPSLTDGGRESFRWLPNSYGYTAIVWWTPIGPPSGRAPIGSRASGPIAAT